jgi:hypothetical protein
MLIASPTPDLEPTEHTMGSKAVVDPTRMADGGRSDPVGLDEALERLLPYCDGSPHRVAERVNLLCRTGELTLLVGGVEINPAAIQSGMITVVISPTGALEGRIQGGWHPDWRRENPVFTFERASFEKHLPGAKRKGNPWAVRAIVKRIQARWPAGLPSGMNIEKVRGLISDKEADGFRPGWDAVKAALIAMGYLPKD